MRFCMLVKVGPRGQITIPKSIRQQFGIRPGDSLAVSTDQDEIILQPVSATIFDLVGVIPVPPEGPYTVGELRETAADYIVDRVLKNDEA